MLAVIEVGQIFSMEDLTDCSAANAARLLTIRKSIRLLTEQSC